MKQFRNRLPVLIGATLSLCGCTLAQGPEDELCEILVADRHSPYVMFFRQDIPVQTERTYTCTFLTRGLEMSIGQMRDNLEPWCRGQIGESMQRSRECVGTRFSESASTILLSGEELSVPGNAEPTYMMRGLVEVIRGAD